MMKSSLKVLFCVLFVISIANAQSRHKPRKQKVQPVFEWNQLSFAFPNATAEEQAIANGNYVVANAIPIDLAPVYEENGKGRVFVTVPRFSGGIPFSLATVSSDGKQLEAYPSYDWHTAHGANCDGITSIFRIALTSCNQIWVVDSGLIGSKQVCPPQLLQFDLNTDKLVYRHVLDESVYIPRASLFTTGIVKLDESSPEDNCQNIKVYMGDVRFHAIVVYDHAQKAAWRAEHRFMYPDPDKGNITIANESFVLMDGIFALNIVGDNLYFHPLASDDEYSVPLSALNDRAAFEKSKDAHRLEFKKLGTRGTGCAGSTADSQGNIYCVTFKPIRLFKWNVNSSYNKRNFTTLSKDEKLLQFVSGMKIVKNNDGQDELWLQSNRFQKYAGGTMSVNEVNYRILKYNL